MQIGIYITTFARPSLEAYLEAVKSHGISHVQFNLACAGLPTLPETIEPALCDRIRRETEARGITIAAVSGTFNMAHPDPDHRRSGLQRLRTLAAACERLGAQVIALCTGTRDRENMWRPHPDNNSPQAWDDLLESMRETARIAEDYGVFPAFEPEVSNVVDSAAKARRLLDEVGSKRLKVVMDGANLFHAGELPQMDRILREAVALLGPDIALVHAKDLDHDGEAGHEAAGNGLLNYALYLSLLAQAGYAGPLILHGLAESQVDGCVAFLREKLAAVTQEGNA